MGNLPACRQSWQEGKAGLASLSTKAIPYDSIENGITLLLALRNSATGFSDEINVVIVNCATVFFTYF